MQPAITIVGLGPGAPEHLTRQALEALQSGVPVYLRTAVHPTVGALAELDIPFHSFDAFYEAHDRFEDVYRAITGAVLEAAAAHGAVVYAVPGHPLVAEATVEALLAHEADYRIALVPGLSFLDAASAALRRDPTGDGGWQLLDALQLPTTLNPRQPLLISQIYSHHIASEIKLQLLEVYPESHPIRLLQRLGTKEERIVELPLVELDRSQPVDHLSCLFVPPLTGEPPESYPITRAISELVEVIRRLRDPVDGCPWDLEQTPKSLCRYIVEEAYETVDAIESEDADAICEELGDLLLQVVLQAQIFGESDDFTLAEIASGLTAKLVRRHPHVFGEVSASTAEEVHRNWEAIKAQEKATAPTLSAKLRKIARQLPALAATAEISAKVVKAGFEWPNAASLWAKLEEELGELRQAIAHESSERQAEEWGDVLFTLINVARWQKLDPEAALRATNRRFLMRFERVEALADRELSHYSIEELEALWQQAKRELAEHS